MKKIQDSKRGLQSHTAAEGAAARERLLADLTTEVARQLAPKGVTDAVAAEIVAEATTAEALGLRNPMLATDASYWVLCADLERFILDGALDAVMVVLKRRRII